MADPEIFSTPPPGMLARTGRACIPTIRYWMETEVHVYAFSIAANVLLSFYPFLIVMVSICRYILHWRGAEQAIMIALNDYFPGAVGEFVGRNLIDTVQKNGAINGIAILLLFFTANGIFEPLEVALNRAWGITKNRSYLRNQIVSLGLIFVVGALALLSAVLTGANQASFIRIVVFKSLSIPISILILFLVYRILPNRRMKAAQILPVSIIVGLALELLKYINLLTLPWLYEKLGREYGPFKNSVTIILWSFLASLIVLAGAEWSARRARER
jgi:YihY family inner membrane protein